MTVLKWNIVPHCVLAATLSLSQAVFGGTAEVTNAEGDTMTFEYQGDNLRIGTGAQSPSYLVVRGEDVYMVSDSDGNLMVIDAGQAWNMVGGLAGSATPEMVANEVISLDATGATERHADIEGEVYRLRYRGDEGAEQETELVLTDDPRAQAFRDAMHHFAATISGAMGQDYNAATDDMQGRLTALNKGVLRYGDDMTIRALSAETVDPTRFELPAEPTDLSNLGALFGQGRSKPSGDGSKSGDSAEQPASAGEKLGEALGRMLGK